MSGEVLAVNVGRPRLKQWRGRTISTAIFKNPVEGRIRVGSEGLEGDQQADRSAHGGVDKAVYVYPTEYYDDWRTELGLDPLPATNFGENLTISGGWLDTEVRIGDRYQIGATLFEVSQPRLPCAKLNLRFERPDMVKRMTANGRVGFYFRVIETGTIAVRDLVERVHQSPIEFTVLDAARLETRDRSNLSLLRLALTVEALTSSWKENFRRRLSMIENS